MDQKTLHLQVGGAISRDLQISQTAWLHQTLSVLTLTFSQGRSGHLASDPASRFRADAWNVRIFPNQDMMMTG